MRQRSLALVALVAAASAAPAGAAPPDPAAGETPSVDSRDAERLAMVSDQIEARGLDDERVLEALRKVPRHEFLPPGRRDLAYADRAVDIGEGQTISQPYIVALMTALAAPAPGDRVLEIGTGSGYQAAVLAALGAEVHTIEIVEPLAQRAAETLARLGYAKVSVHVGDGSYGWADAAPYQAILVTARAPVVPEALREQLAAGGRLVIPVGPAGAEQLELHVKTKDGFEVSRVLPVRFVPMTGAAGEKRPARSR